MLLSISPKKDVFIEAGFPGNLATIIPEMVKE
jgi:hypothetical protein